MRRPLPLGLSPRSGRTLAPGRLLRAALRAPNIPLTAAPHGVGCEVTRGDPGGGGGALFRRSIDGLPATRSYLRCIHASVYDLPVWHIFSNQTYKPKIIKSGMAYHISRSNQRGRPN